MLMLVKSLIQLGAEDLFKKFYNEYTSVPIESYSVEITNFFFDTDLATRKTVPTYINWEK
jgi:hypothetical protein